MESGIYKITNLTTGKIYIGQSINLAKRFVCHKGDLNRGDHCNAYLQAAWNKYGEADFVFEIVEFVAVEQLTEREKHYILTLGTLISEQGYNLEIPAFNGPKIFSEESIQKMRESSTGFRHSEETKKKISQLKMGNPSRSGQKNSEEVNRLNSQRMMGNKIWEGRKHSPETKEKMRLARLGKKFPKPSVP